MMSDVKEDLTCTMCHDTKETYSEIVYSRGSRVCIDCKKETQRADDTAFDNYMKSKIIDGFHVVK